MTKILRLLQLICFAFFSSSMVNAQIITNFAGGNDIRFSGDGGAATEAIFNFPIGLAFDAAGNLFVADGQNYRIRKITASGIISTTAGNGIGMFSGDGGPASAAGLMRVGRIVVDVTGNVYFTDANRIRKIDVAGTISTIAGDDIAGYSGDGGPATDAKLNSPVQISLDGIGNIYVADASNNRIRKIDVSGIISTIAGSSSGFAGDGGPATAAQLATPSGIATDALGNIFVADAGNSRIRMIDGLGNITTVAGTGTAAFSGDGGPATSAMLYSPNHLSVDMIGNLIICETGSRRVRKINTSGIISTIAGNGEPYYNGDGMPATMAHVSYPAAAIADVAGNIYISDAESDRIRKVDLTGNITTIYGHRYLGDNGPATAAQLRSPLDMCFDASGNAYVTEQQGYRVRKINSAGIITTFAGNGSSGSNGDGGPATAAQVNFPGGIAADATGNVYICDVNNNRIRKVDNTGIITTFAGNGNFPSTLENDVMATATAIQPKYAVADASGNIYFTEYWRVRKINNSGIITTIAGSTTSNCSGDGGPATNATFKNAGAISIDLLGNIYVTDDYCNTVRKISTDGLISTVAGSGGSAYSPDGSLATTASFQRLINATPVSDGTIVLCEQDGHLVRLVNNNGLITTIAGNGGVGHSGDGGSPLLAEIGGPSSARIDANDDLYIVQFTNSVVRKITGLSLDVKTNASDILNTTLAPNPATTQLNIRHAKNIYSVDIIDLAGNLAGRYINNSSSIDIDISNLINGIYCVVINNSEIYKIVKEN